MLHHPSDQPDDDDDPMGGANECHGSEDEDEDEDEDEGEDRDDRDGNIRDQIARQMWDDYVQLRHARGLDANNIDDDTDM